MFKLTVEGTVYEFDPSRMLLAEAREIKTYTKMTIPAWSMGIDEMDPDSMQSLIYLAKKRAGESLRYSDLDTLDFADIELEPMDDEAEDGEPEAAGQAADPTPPGETGTTPTPATSDTSDPSPTTSSTPPATSSV
ncbi:hypothetical protein [Streptomyces sp. NPDC048663]|uniref:hypothetical protein n=1 Tax=Streptomyces sp. NPDC048663 TaxID=3155638 RepID=UPI00342B7C99